MHSISLEPYIIWFSLMEHMCKRIISPGFLPFFQIFGFISRVKWQKKIAQNHKKLCLYVCQSPYLRKHILHDCDFWYTFVKWWHLQRSFFVFSKFWFFRLLGRQEGKKMAQNDKKIMFVSLRNSGTVPHMIVVLGKQV